MTHFRMVMLCAVLGLVGVSCAAAQRAGAATKANATLIEDLDELDPPFKAWTGIDYGPLQSPPPRVNITNMTGIFVETPLECAVRCNDEKLCNAASFFGDNPVGSWPSGFTCWLKTIGVPCTLPADYEVSEFPDTIFLLAQEEECEEDEPSILAPLLSADAPGPDAGPLMAELENDPLMAPLEDYVLENDPLMAPLEDGPLMASDDAPLDAMPLADGGPAPAPGGGVAGIPTAAPLPAAPVATSGGLITDFEVGSAPAGASGRSPTPPAPRAQPAIGDTARAPAPGPDDTDNFPDAFSPQAAFGLNRETGGSGGLRAAVGAVAAAAAAVCLMA